MWIISVHLNAMRLKLDLVRWVAETRKKNKAKHSDFYQFCHTVVAFSLTPMYSPGHHPLSSSACIAQLLVLKLWSLSIITWNLLINPGTLSCVYQCMNPTIGSAQWAAHGVFFLPTPSLYFFLKLEHLSKRGKPPQEEGWAIISPRFSKNHLLVCHWKFQDHIFYITLIFHHYKHQQPNFPNLCHPEQVKSHGSSELSFKWSSSCWPEF